MKAIQGLFLLAFLAFSFVQADELPLEGAKVYNVYPVTSKQRQIVNGMEGNFEGVDVWQKSHSAGREARIFVTEKVLQDFEDLLDFHKIGYEILMNDPKKTLAEEVMRNKMARSKRNAKVKIDFESYHRHDDINAYLDDLAVKYPKVVKVVTATKTSENRDLKYIKISTTDFADKKKPVAIFDAAVHAREWIAPSVALYMINKLVENVTESDLVSKMDWIIFPVLNPDGYEYSHTNNRLWRKTRVNKSGLIGGCRGVDVNRNFDFHWMESGASNNSCAEDFAGEKPFSELETSALGQVIREFKGRAKWYTGIHSHGSCLLYPWGYAEINAPNYEELRDIGRKVVTAIENAAAPNSPKYLLGNAAIDLYPAAGGSDDYAMAVGNISVSYTLELPSGGGTGFDIPPYNIKQIVRETWEGLIVLARYVIEKGV